MVSNIVRRMVSICTTLGVGALVGIMVLLVVSIVIRLLGHAVTGSYELVELFIVVTVVFALGYTAMNKGHIVIDILVSRFPQRVQAIIDSFNTTVTACYVAVLIWASIKILGDRWVKEQTLVSHIPYFPFRFVWVFGWFLFCLILLIDLFRALNKALKK